MFPTIHITFKNPLKALRWLVPRIEVNLGHNSIVKILTLLKKAGVPVEALVAVWEGINAAETADTEVD